MFALSLTHMQHSPYRQKAGCLSQQLKGIGSSFFYSVTTSSILILPSAVDCDSAVLSDLSDSTFSVARPISFCLLQRDSLSLSFSFFYLHSLTSWVYLICERKKKLQHRPTSITRTEMSWYSASLLSIIEKTHSPRLRTNRLETQAKLLRQLFNRSYISSRVLCASWSS